MIYFLIFKLMDGVIKENNLKNMFTYKVDTSEREISLILFTMWQEDSLKRLTSESKKW